MIQMIGKGETYIKFIGNMIWSKKEISGETEDCKEFGNFIIYGT